MRRRLLLLPLLAVALAVAGFRLFAGTLDPGRPPLPTATADAPLIPVPRPSATAQPIEDTPPSPEAIAWLKQNAVPFDTTKPGSGFADLMPLKEMVGSARIVVLGDPMNGDPDFTEMKLRLLEFLVEEMGFDGFAASIDSREAEQIDDYVHTGTGELDQMPASRQFSWNLLGAGDVIRWLHAHNRNPGRAPEVSFYGYGMMGLYAYGVNPHLPYSQEALDGVIAYLEKVDPQAASLDSSDLEDLEARLIGHRARYEAASSPREFARALGDIRAARQWERLDAASDPEARSDLVTRFAAENVASILELAGPRAKIVVAVPGPLAGVNYDVGGLSGQANNASSLRSLGAYLWERFGEDMLVFTFALYQGGFTAAPGRPSESINGVDQAARRPLLAPETSYEHYLHTAGMPRLFLDLRKAHIGGPSARWLLAPHYFRSFLAFHDACYPDLHFYTTSLAEEFDVVIFFDETSPSLPPADAPPAGEPRAAVEQCPTGPRNLDFEADLEAWFLSSSNPDGYQFQTDLTRTHGGKMSGRLAYVNARAVGPATLSQVFRADDYRGQRVRLSGYLKTEANGGKPKFWLAADGIAGKQLRFEQADLPDLADWHYVQLDSDLPVTTVRISFGVSVEGRGDVWLDDLRFDIVGDERQDGGS